MSTETRRILIVDDHPISRSGIAALLATDPKLTICGEAASAAEALTQIEALEPDLALIDINLPDRSGLELIKDLKAMRPNLRLVAISMHDESLFAERVLRAGGQGYISKQAGSSEMAEAIHKVFEGGIYVSEETAEKLLRMATAPQGKAAPDNPLGLLTDREFEVFQHMGEGRNTKAIAERLRVSPRTVEAHRTNIKDKLQLKDMTELIHYAVQWSERSL